MGLLAANRGMFAAKGELTIELFCGFPAYPLLIINKASTPQRGATIERKRGGVCTYE
jgi:hypothetical protein